ncbi:MAG: class I SAM-dependent methyltransferase [Gammaproteobacteria bacterium]|nr:class I SAM-dependent methyltransferase [Gammaproteobacteria bacterium]
MRVPASDDETVAGNRTDNRDQPSPAIVPDETIAAWRLRITRNVGVLSIPFGWLLKVVRLVESAIPVGLLRRGEIEHVVHSAYAAAPDFYNPGKYPIRYEEQLVPVIERAIGAPQGQRLLDLYCGHGREAEIFARTGFDVLAVDVQPAVIDRARAYAAEAGFSASFRTADIDTWTPPDTNWDIVYTSLWMYSTIPDRGSRIAWLKRLANWVAPGGCLVVSVTPGSKRPGPLLRHSAAWFVRLLTLNSRRPEFGDRFHTGLFWHDFTPESLDEELEAAGMEVLDTLEVGGATPCNFYLLRARAAES